MRKRINLVLVICLVALIACSLFACNKDGSEYVDKVPEELGLDIDPITGGESTNIDGGSAVIEFSFTKEVSSLLHSIIIDPEDGFDITSVNYSVIYRKGAQATVTNEKPLTLDYIDEADRPLLKQPGFHTIHATVPYRGSTVRGSFTMRLKYEYEEVKYIELVFNVNGGIPHFATATGNTVKTTVEDGLTFSYDEFIRYFTITKSDCAIEYFTVEGNPVKTLSRTAAATGSGKSSTITLKEGTRFTVKWTENTVKATFKLNAPTTSVVDGKSIPDMDDYAQDVAQSVGTVRRPDLDMNIFNGYIFAGWYDESTNNAWIFTNPAGQKNISLYAKWVVRYYETTIYPMSSTFKTDLKNSVSEKGSKKELKSLEAAEADGYIVAKCDVTFNASTNNVLSVDISGLVFGKPYSDYVAEIRVKNTNNAEDKRIIILSQIFTAFEKLTPDEDLNKKIVSGGVLYSSQECKDNQVVDIAKKITENQKLFVKWSLDLEGLNQNDRKAVLSSFYTNVLYKDSYEIKPDGSVKLIDIKDETFCDIIVPDSITIDGTDRYISEFASKAAMNVRSLGKLDLSEASHLKTIGAEAFINCTNLYEVVWPEDNNLEKFGKKVFKNTAFEENYPSDYMTVNGILYKFRDKKAKEIDMTTCEESGDLTDIKVIGDSAFADSLLLEKVTLPVNVEVIGDSAFANLEVLKQVNAGSKLYKVSATAFTGTQLIKDTDTSDDAVNNTINIKDNAGNDIPAVKVGNVLVKVLDEYATSIKIESSVNITAIADEALILCKNVEDFTVLAPEKIEYIGANACSAMVGFLQTQTNGYFVINGILSDYFNKDYNFYDAVVPGNVTTISSYAFNSYARFLKTIQINDSVKKIDEYAFAGATNLKSLLFSDVEVIGGSFVNLPEIDDNAFSNEESTMISDLNFYFYQSAIDRFESLSLTGGTLTSVEEAWLKLYKQNKDSFHVEKIEKVYVNEKKVDSTYVINGAFDWPAKADGIILESNAGVLKYVDLTSDMLDDFNDSQEGIHTANIKVKTDWGTVENGTQYVPFEYKVIFKVLGDPGFYTTKDKNFIDGNVLSVGSNYYIDGFEGIAGYATPTFYTTKRIEDFDEIKFMYKTNQGGATYSSVPVVEITEFSPNANNTSTIYFTFDFYGAGIYKVAVQYDGVEPKVEKIEQAGPISIPLNANVRAALNESEFYFSGEDGIRELTAVDMNEYEVISVNGSTDNLSLVSNTLGLNTVVLKYRGSRKAVSELANVTVVYAVVLEGDPNQFTFEIKKGNAVITAHSNKDVETLVIPSSYVKDGIEYAVTEIGSNVFANYKNLVTVYLPATLEKIMDSAFSGCALLEKVYSSESTANVKTDIADSDFDILTSNVISKGTVALTGTDIKSGTIVIPEVIVSSEKETDFGTYKEYSVFNAIPVLTKAMFEQFQGTLYIDYTADNYAFVKENLLDVHKNTFNGIAVVFMFRTTEAVSTANGLDSQLDFLPYNETSIKSVTEEISRASAEGLTKNYVYYYVITKDEPRKVSTAQRHFTFNENEFVPVEKYIEQTRKLKSLSSLNGETVIIVGDTYVNEYVDDTEHVYYNITSTTTATEAEITYSESSLMIYLPDTIFNTCVIKDSSGNSAETIIYKHGQALLYSTNEYLPESVTYIGSSAFNGCISLKALDFSKSTTLNYIGSNAFEGSGLVSVDLSETIIDTINGSTFRNCKSLESVIIPSTVKNIGSYAFDACPLLTLPSMFFKYVDFIDSYAFSVCDSFTAIDLTETSAKTIRSQAFSISGATISVNFAEGSKPAGWANDWNGICSVEYL